MLPGFLLCLSFSSAFSGQPASPDWDRVAAAARALRPPGAGGGRAVLDALEARAREALQRIEHPLDRPSWEQAVPRLREKLASSLGLSRLPKPQARNARRVGTVDRGSYVIEKVVYETFPQTAVPALLYRPAVGEEKLPAVLFVPGHWWADSKSRPDFQAFCINMARRGFVVLTYDPIGQGERGISWRDHRRTELLVVGVAQQAVVAFESLCALEYLLQRPEVDPQRVGITGASGGGYNSWILGAMDPRIAVSVPVVGTSEFYEQIHVCRPLDWYNAKEHCHFVPGLLRYANNHEFLAMIAPRPVMIIAAHRDQSFPIPGIREVANYGRRLFASLEAPRRFGYFEDTVTGHGYQKRKREAAYGWFLRWLKGEGDGRALAEPPTEAVAWNSEELRCFPVGENRGAGQGIVAHVKTVLDSWPARRESPEGWNAERAVIEALGLLSRDTQRTSSRKFERVEARLEDGLRLERVVWEQQDGVKIPGLLLIPPGDSRGALLAASDGGKESLLGHAAVRAALDSSLAVLLADPRGLGELATTQRGWVFAVSLLLGENFVGRQVLDLVAAWRHLRSLPEVEGKPVGLLGSGPFASAAALYAAVMEPRVAWLICENGFVSYRSFVDRERSLQASYTLAAPGEERSMKIDREIPHSLVVFDVLRKFDLPDLLVSLSPRPVLVASAIDGDWAPLSGEALGRLLRQGRFSWPSTPPHCAGSTTTARMEALVRRVSR